MSDKWYELINATSQERTAIDLEELEEETQDRIEQLAKATFLLNHIVCFNAKRIQDEYKNIYTDIKEREKLLHESERGKKSNLRFRVRLSKKHTLMAEWYREKYRYGEICHETLSRDYKYAYSPKVFNKEPSWAKENGKRAEKRLSILREQNDLLHSMRKQKRLSMVFPFPFSNTPKTRRMFCRIHSCISIPQQRDMRKKEALCPGSSPSPEIFA